MFIYYISRLLHCYEGKCGAAHLITFVENAWYAIKLLLLLLFLLLLEILQNKHI
jgi:hypothetical protein